MADASDLLEQLRAHLIAEGIARHPDAGGPLPPLWIQPEGGAPAPGDKSGVQNHADLVVTAQFTGGLAAPRYASDRRRDTVDFWLRARRAPFAMEAEAQLRGELVGDLGRRNWNMAGLTVVESLEWAALRSSTAYAGPGHTFVWTCLFEYWA